MLCTRCGGLLIKGWWDFPYGMAQGELQGTRCVNCGSIDDPVIRANKRPSHRSRMTLTRGTVNNPNSPGLQEGRPIRPRVCKEMAQIWITFRSRSLSS